MTAETRMTVEGIYLNREPIFFEEGGIPEFVSWMPWLQRRHSHLKLLLKLETAPPQAIDHIVVRFTAGGKH